MTHRPSGIQDEQGPQLRTATVDTQTKNFILSMRTRLDLLLNSIRFKTATSSTFKTYELGLHPIRSPDDHERLGYPPGHP